MREERVSLVNKPEFMSDIESKIADTFSLHPNVISAIKLLVLTPLFGYFLFHSSDYD